MANDINIPFIMELKALKNANAVFGTELKKQADNVVAHLDEKLQSVFAKFGKEVKIGTGISADLKNIDSGFAGIVTRIERINRLTGANSTTSTLLGSLPQASQKGAESLARLDKVARNIFSRLISDSERTRAIAGKALSGLFRSDTFAGDNNSAKNIFNNILGSLLDEYINKLKSSQREINKEEQRTNAERLRIVEETENRIEQERVARRKVDLQATLETNRAKLAAEEDYQKRIAENESFKTNQNRQNFIAGIENRGSTLLNGQKVQGSVLNDPLINSENDEQKRQNLVLRKEGLTLINREIGLTKELIKEQKAKRNLGINNDAEINASRARLYALEEERRALQSIKAVPKESQNKELTQIVGSLRERIDLITKQVDLEFQTVRTRREELSYARRLESATEKVARQQEKIKNLLLQTKAIRGNLTGVELDALQNFANADAGTIAAGRLNKTGNVLTTDQIQVLTTAVKQTNSLAQANERNALSVENFGKAAALAFKRYGAFIVGSFGIYRLQAAFTLATDEALKFEAAMTKIQQVTTNNIKQINEIGKAIRSAGVATGTSISEIADIVQTFAQAGFQDPDQLRRVADTLSKIPLAATFGDLKSTTEGLIAVFGQFNKTLDDTPQILDLVNQFAADFATESGDIFEGVKRGGAIFAEAGGSLEEFVALFSLLRSATRQSAETIGTFFKSGIAELLSERAQKRIKTLGVQATEVIPQIQELAQVLFAPDFKGNVIRESSELIGNRQVGLLVALFRELEQSRIKALRSGDLSQVEKSLKSASGSLNRDIIIRLDDVGVSLNRIKQSFVDFAIQLIQDNGIKGFIKDIADLTTNLLGLAKVITPIIPTVTALGAAIALPRFVSGIRGRTGHPQAEALAVALGQSVDVVQSRLSAVPDRTRITRGQLAGGAAIAGLVGAGFVANQFADRPGSTGQFARNVGTVSNTAGLGALAGSVIPGIGPIIGGLTGAAVGLILALRENTKVLRKQEIEIKTSEELLAEMLAVQNNSILTANGPDEFTSSGLRTRSLDGDIIFKSFRTWQEASENVVKTIGNDTDLYNKVITELSAIKDEGLKETQRFFVEKQVIPNANEFQVVRQLITEQLLRDSQFKSLDPTILFEKFPVFKLNDKQVASSIEKSVAILDTFVEKLDSIINDLVLQLSRFDKELNSTNDSISNISTNINESVKIFRPFDNSNLLKGAGFDIGFDPSILGQKLQNFFNRPDVRSSLVQLRNPTNQESPQAFDLNSTSGTFNTIVKDLFSRSLNSSSLISQFTKEFGDIFQGLAEFNKVPIGKIFDDIFNADTIAEGADAVQKRLTDLVGKISDAYRKQADLLQKRIEKENALGDATRQLNQQLFDLNTRISAFANQSLDRKINNNLGLNTNQSRDQRISLLQSTAQRSQFGNTAQFITSFLDSNQRRISLQQAALSGRGNFAVNDQQVIDSNKADQEFKNNQQELNQRISEFDVRITAASQATDLLKESFLSLRDDIRSAGQSITSLTRKDFGSIVSVVNRFVQGGGVSNPFGPLSTFTSSQFGLLQQGLGLVGNISLGGGNTGNNILQGIQDQLGLTVVAGIKSLFTGQDETANVAKELADARKKAEDAAKAEELLRKEQLDLLKAQAAVIPTEIQFYSDQLTVLNSIDTNLSVMADIRNSVTKLFGSDAQRVTLDNKGASNSIVGNGPIADITKLFTPKNNPNNLIPQRILTPSGENEFTPRSIRIPNVVQIPTSRPEIVPSGPLDELGRPRTNRSVPGFETPSPNIPRGTAPELIMSTKNTEEINTGVSNLIDITNNIQKVLEKLGETQKMTLELAPMQINVVLAAPDILALAGPQLQANITKEIAVKLAEVFKTDPETSSKILSSLGTK